MECWLEHARDIDCPACISSLLVHRVHTAAHGSGALTRACDVRPTRSLLACLFSGARDIAARDKRSTAAKDRVRKTLKQISGLLGEEKLRQLGWIDESRSLSLDSEQMVDQCWAQLVFPWRRFDCSDRGYVQAYLAYTRCVRCQSARACRSVHAPVG